MNDALRDARLWALVAALVAHGGLGAVVAKSPAPEPFEIPEPDRTEVRTFEADVTLPKPPPPKPRAPEPAPPEPPPPEPPPPEPPKPTEAPKPVETRAPEPKAAPQRPPRPAKASKAPAKAGPQAAPTVRVANLAPGAGNVRAYGGSEDSFGSPDERATPENETAPSGPSGNGPRDATGTAPSGNGAGETQAAAPGPAPTAPKVKYRAPAVYPPGAPRTGKPIALTLALDIDDTGRVVSARIVSKPRVAGTFFDDAAVAAARKTTFTPATRGGAAVPFSIRYVVRFEVDG